MCLVCLGLRKCSFLIIWAYVQGMQGQIISCPVAIPGKYFIQWECSGNVLDVMNAKLAHIMNAVSSQKASVNEKVEAMDMLSMMKRLGT